MVMFIQETLMPLFEVALRDPFFARIWGVAVFLFQMGVLSFLCIELIKRVEKLFVKEDGTNWRIVHRERPFFKREFLTELCFPFINMALRIPFGALQLFIFAWTLEALGVPHQPYSASLQELPLWVQVCIGVILLDLILYIRHRFVHEFFWTYHIIHHSVREITWLSYLRLHPLDSFVMGLIKATCLYFVGFGGEGIAIAAAVQNHFNRFNHSNINLDYGWPLRYIFVSPNMHRWHHAANDPEAFNKNYAIVFAWIDVLFGTFYVPKNRLPEEYGVLDENGEHVVGEGLWEQFAYPFRVMRDDWRAFREKRASRARHEPAGE